ncbi:MAG: ABC transporter permease [Planctomycetota bacterium]
MSRSRTFAVARVAFREFWRAPEAVFWTYGFPLLMTVVLGFAFQPQEPEPIPVAVVAGSGAAALAPGLDAHPRLRAELLDEAAADTALARGRVGAIVRGSAAEPVVRADPTRPDAELARLWIARALHPDAAAAEPRFESEERPGARYIDFLIPGLIGLNLLGAGLWGIGFQLVQYRTQNLLRRLFVTPMRRSEFLLGLLLSRLVLALPESLIIGLFGVLFWGVPFRGSLLVAALVLLAASLAFSGLGVLVASRARTIEGVAGLMNLCMMPMWLLGGAFFSNERMTGVLRWAADAVPLSWCTAAMRDLMLSPGGLAEVWPELLLLSGFAAVCFGAALRLFRWT